MIVFVGSILLTELPVTLAAVVGVPALGEVLLVGVCIGGLTSVTVGTDFTGEVTEFCALKVVRMIVPGVVDITAGLLLLTGTGPLLTGGELLLLSGGPPPGM